MSRESRKRQRKARVQMERANPKPPTIIPWKAARNPDTRWLNLSARGGHRLSYTPVGHKVDVDLDDATAPFALALAIVGVDQGQDN